MNKRLIIKTAFICFGTFILLSSIILWILLGKYELDREIKYRVVTAKVPIERGTVINESMLQYRTIKESALNNSMAAAFDEIAGKKAAEFIEKDDYIRNYILIPKEEWYKDDERVIVLPMEVEERMSNLIRKGTFIDIKQIAENVKSVPQLVLAKIRVEDVLDENGVSLGSTGVNKKAYAKLILDKSQRDRLYISRDNGKLVFELYCDTTQQAPEEIYQIPAEYLESYPGKRGGGNIDDKLPQRGN